MSNDPLSIGASLEEIKRNIAQIQEKGIDSHYAEYEEIFQELNRTLNELAGL